MPLDCSHGSVCEGVTSFLVLVSRDDDGSEGRAIWHGDRYAAPRALSAECSSKLGSQHCHVRVAPKHVIKSSSISAPSAGGMGALHPRAVHSTAWAFGDRHPEARDRFSRRWVHAPFPTPIKHQSHRNDCHGRGSGANSGQHWLVGELSGPGTHGCLNHEPNGRRESKRDNHDQNLFVENKRSGYTQPPEHDQGPMHEVDGIGETPNCNQRP